MKKKVSAIVPAYNEEKTLSAVLDVLIASSNIDEIICVNDGSTDKTANIIRSRPKIVGIHLRKNYGKAYAIAQGIEKAKGDIVLFIDADIFGLTDKNIQQLINPLKNGRFDCVIGYRCSRMEATVGVPFSGERAYFKKDLLPHIKHFEKKGYGLELYLNYQFNHKRKKICKLKGVFSYSKHHKYPYLTATKLYTQETYQVMHEIISKENSVSFFVNAYLYYVHVNNRQIFEYSKIFLGDNNKR